MIELLRFLSTIDVMPLVLVAFVGIIAISFWRLDRNPANDFNLLDLLMEHGRVSKVSVIVMGAFAVTTWGFVVDCLSRGELDVAILGAYGGLWVAPLLMKLYSAGQSDAVVTTTTTTAAAVTTTTPAKKKGK